MMDWTESSSFPSGQKAACARRVRREVQENLATANVNGLSEVIGGADTVSLLPDELAWTR